MTKRPAVVPGYYLVCYNFPFVKVCCFHAVVPGYYLVCYNCGQCKGAESSAVVPGYYLVCYNSFLLCGFAALL